MQCKVAVDNSVCQIHIFQCKILEFGENIIKYSRNVENTYKYNMYIRVKRF